MRRLVIWTGLDEWRTEAATVDLTESGVVATGVQLGVGESEEQIAPVDALRNRAGRQPAIDLVDLLLRQGLDVFGSEHHPMGTAQRLVLLESSEVESMRVMTAGFPAEYGRKLGGVVEVSSPKNNPKGLHG